MGAQRITNADTNLQEGNQSLGWSLKLGRTVPMARMLVNLDMAGLAAGSTRRSRRTTAPTMGV